MENEPPPTDRSDSSTLTASELLRQTVDRFALIEGDGNSVITKMGIVDLGPGKLVLVEVSDPQFLFPNDILHSVPIKLYKLTVISSQSRSTDDREGGYIESVTVSGPALGTVIGEIDLAEINNMTPREEEEFIVDFFARHNLIELLGLDELFVCLDIT